MRVSPEINKKRNKKREMINKKAYRNDHIIVICEMKINRKVKKKMPEETSHFYKRSSKFWLQPWRSLFPPHSRLKLLEPLFLIFQS